MVRVRCAKGLPELFIFLALFHDNRVTIGSFLVLLEQGNVFKGGLLVELFILRKDLRSLPQPELVFALDNKHRSWVKSLIAFSSLIKIIHLESSYYVKGVFWLMRGHKENTGSDGKGFKRFFIQSLVELGQLSDESHIRVYTSSPCSNISKSFLESHLLFEDQISDTDSTRARYSLYTVDVNTSVGVSGILHELDSVVKDTLNVLFDIIFQMVTAVGDAFILEVIFTEVCGTVNNMGDASIFESFLVFGDHIAAEVEEFINNL